MDQIEGQQNDDHDCAKSVLTVLRISTTVTSLIIIAIIVLSVVFIHRAEVEYNDNQARILFNHNVSVNCPGVLNIPVLSCDYLCYHIFERANFSMIGAQCLDTFLYLNMSNSKFIVDCVGFFKDTGDSINKNDISTYSDYITGQNIQNIMLPMMCFALLVQIIIHCGIQARLRRSMMR